MKASFFRTLCLLLISFGFLSGCTVDPRLVQSYREKIDFKKLPISDLDRFKVSLSKIKDEDVARLSKRIFLEGERNFVLNATRTAILLFDKGHYKEANFLLKDATILVESFFKEDVWAQKSKEIYTTDSIKDFKGDAYERSMMFYYLGLSYLALKQPRIASAAFRNAFEQDSFAEDQRYRSDFYLMPLLADWASYFGDQLDGNVNPLIPEKFRKLLPEKGSTLVLIEFGNGIEKKAIGQYLSALSFGKRFDRKTDSYLFLQKSPYTKVADLHYQATTRGSRGIDAIVANKVVFRKDLESASKVAGAGAVVAGSVAANAAIYGDNDAAAAAAAVTVVAGSLAIIAELAARSAETKADLRYVDNLPTYVSAALVKGEIDSLVSKLEQKIGKAVKVTRIFDYAGKALIWINLVRRDTIPNIAPGAHLYAKELKG